MSVHRPPCRRSVIGRVMLMVAALIAVAAACSSTDDSAAEPTTTTIEPPGLGDPGIATVQGQLAVVDGHEISVMAPDGSGVQAVAGSDTEIATQPTWSPDGSRLAWAVTDGQTSRVDAGVPGAEEIDTTPVPSLPFYLAWNDRASEVAYLRPVTAERFEVGTIEPGGEPVPGDAGAPLYLAWRPEADALALHVDADRMELLDLGPSPQGPVPFAATDGQFAAPVWADDDQVLVVQNGALIRFDVETGDQRELLQVGEITRLVLSPDRTRLAYLTVAAGTQTIGFPSPRQQLPEAPDTVVRLRVFDLVAGRDVLVTDQSPIAFEWSPDSTFLSWLGPAGVSDVQWHIWSSAGEFTTLTPYRPSPLDSGAYLPFFDQYAQSQHRWEPQGLAMAYAGTIGGVSGIWVETIEGDLGPVRVADGDYVTWSPPPGGGAGASIL